MLRDPRGVDHGSYNGDWNDKDTKNWSEENKKQVPYKDADDGVFFVEDKDFVKAFDTFTINHYSEKKKASHFDVKNDDGNAKVFTFEVPSDQEGFVGMSFYNERMYPNDCKK